MSRLIQNLFRMTWPSILVALTACIAIVVAIDPAGSYPNMFEGPGLTVDEIFNVEQGVLLVERARALGWLNLVPTTSLHAFTPSPENPYLPDHPPLGRYWLGIHHHLTWWIFPPFDPEGACVTACARTGSATAFALTIWIVGLFATAHYGRMAGLFASIALVLMPRLYGHAHIASLETITNLTCTAAVLSIAHWWSQSNSGPQGGRKLVLRPVDGNVEGVMGSAPSFRVALLTGVVMGLALLTKIQAILIPIPVIVWALWRWREKAIVPLLVWGVTANVVFFALWPYLWLDPIGHFLEYLGRTTNRSTIHCFYFGVRYTDKAVPWHYPFVMFAVTVPLGLHLLGVLGLWKSEVRSQKPEGETGGGRQEAVGTAAMCGGSLDGLLLACTVFPLIVFALPGVAVYDGERLFLTAFPLWAVFVGRGMYSCWTYAPGMTSRRLIRAVLSAVVIWSAALSIQLCPYQLCYYNELVCGQSGADRLGLEIDYWGVGVSRRSLDFQDHDFTLAMGPTLHQFQADDYRRQSPLLRKQNIKVIAAETIGEMTVKAILFRRRADLPHHLDQRYIPPKFPGRWWGKEFVSARLIEVKGDYNDLPKSVAPSP